ncbi:MAG: chromosome segregation protein SMC [Qingshengfaniella sp.]
MQFTRLRLNGFKSFVDPTDLVIASGLTGVVGPNGCGKSNLLEALRWVMGETRPSAMRGGGMEDVIFAGAATRPARNFAEVSLSIDNGERLAPAGFNDSDMIDIVRRITRDAGSAYRAGGREVRARDVQMLFADASTGAHSPALVRQGQISELINAKPKSRRRVLEEAAGISGLYQRRHEAELKLRATEQNLERVEDVITQLAGQLAQLARQAKQAARYRAIGEELRSSEDLLLYLRWREADLSLAGARQRLTDAIREAAGAEAAARAAGTAREEAEDGLPAIREEEAIAAAVLQRLLVQRDTLADQARQADQKIQSLGNRLTQLDRDRDREVALTHDAGETMDRLALEQTDLAEAGDGHDAALEEAQDAAREAAQVLQAREADLGDLTEDVARLAARHQSVERLLADSRKTRDRSEAATEEARQAVAAARTAAVQGAGAEAQATEARDAAQEALDMAEDRLLAAEAARADAQGAEAETRGALSEAEGEAKALAAEVAALTRLVDRDEDGSQPLLDDITVAAGFENALGAALGDDLRAPLAADGGSGWRGLADYDAAAPLPEGADSLAAHVTAPPVLARRLAQIGIVAADRGAALQGDLRPGQRLVSVEGDLWRWDGLHALAADAPSAAAQQLKQRNRLAMLRDRLHEAVAGADAARAAQEAAAMAHAAASAAEKDARAARRTADAALGDANRALTRAEADRSLAEGRLETLALAVTRHEDEAGAARLQLSEAEHQAADLDDLDDLRARVDDVRMTVEAARITMMSRRSAHDEIRRAGEARLARAQAVAKELAGWSNRRATADQRLAELEARRAEAAADLAVAEDQPAALAADQEKLAEAIGDAERRKAEASDALSSAETLARRAAETEREAERRAGEAREARARAEAHRDAAAEAETQTRHRIDEETGKTPETLLDADEIDPATIPTAEALEATVARLRRQRDALGAVNLRAEEDAREVEAEHDTLVAEKADLENAVAKLRAGIAGLNREGRERLLTAFEQVNSNFGALFTHLFGGGEAKLVLVESDDPLDAGLEIMCQPPGKKLSTLSLLSGGEQTLTAMALIFAVFLANPAPICVLDEVDAPLDDANVTRFCDMLDEMTRRTQTRFLIITHHAVTMARMDRLFGVTMQEQGVSQLVSVDLRKAEQLVA